MVRRRLGRTGIELSVIGFGAFKIGRNQKVKYAQVYDLPSDDEVQTLIGGILDLGVNYIDTAPAYGTSEERLGSILKSFNRDDLFVSTKVGETFENGVSSYDFSPEAVMRSVARSCKRLKLETLDLVFLHSDGNDLDILQQSGAVNALEQLRANGQVRCIGFSGKTILGARAALEWADAIMVEFHCENPSHAPIMELARTRGIGVTVKKGLASGQLPPEKAIPFVVRNPGVTSMVIGGLNLEHFRQNVEIADSIGIP